MNSYLKLTAALAAFALVVVLGLSAQNTVQAQATVLPTLTVEVVSGTSGVTATNSYLCTTCEEDDKTFEIEVEDAAAEDADADTDGLQVEVSVKGGSAAAKDISITLDDTTKKGTTTVKAVNKSTGLAADEVTGFNGDEIEVRYTRAGVLGTSKTLIVDNVKPTMVVTSPDRDMVVKKNVMVVFTAEVTDDASGFPKGTGGGQGQVAASAKGAKGGIRLILEGQNVPLAASNFSTIDDGWRVSKALNSTDISNIGNTLEWSFEAVDLAGNHKDNRELREESDPPLVGQVTEGSEPEFESGTDITFASDTFKGDSKYPDDYFNGETVELKLRSGDSVDIVDTVKVKVIDFLASEGRFTVNIVTDVSDPNIAASSPSGDIEFSIGTGLVSAMLKVDEDVPALGSIITGNNWGGTPAKIQTGVKAKNTSIQVNFLDLGGLNPDTVTSSAFVVSGNTVSDVNPQDGVKTDNLYHVFLTLEQPLGSNEKPSVSISGGVIKDRAGNAYGGGNKRAADGLGPKITLALDRELSNKEVKLTINSDEQLSASPTVTVRRVESAGAGTLEDTTVNGTRGQTTALSYTYTVRAASVAAEGGKFNVYVEGRDTHGAGNPGAAGNKTNPNAGTSVTFQLDRMLNGGKLPKVTVSGEDAASAASTAPKVDAVDPMIVTVDFSAESGEYPGDSHGTVELTSASLKITAKDGTSETRTFNLTTEISSPDNKKFTIPLLNPKVGKYALTVKAKDQAGNNTRTGQATAAQSLTLNWEVTAPKPVAITLLPGWNLASLPFQPGNPAINSVIPANHPVDIVMTYDNASRAWLVSRRDSESGLFVGDISMMTANTAYFLRTDSYSPVKVLRPPMATAAAAPPPPPAITVVKGWNLVPVVSNAAPIPTGVAADAYFGTLGTGANTGWLKALTFNTLVRTWTSVTPGQATTLTVGATNPCTGADLKAARVSNGTEPCQQVSGSATYTDRSTADGADDGAVGAFDGNDTVVIKTPVIVGKGYWLYSTVDGVIIP